MMGFILALLTPPAQAGGAGVGGYFRIAARPDLQGGGGRLGYWNLYGRLLNEGSYGMLELRYDVLDREPGLKAPWSTVHARIEGGTIGNADPLNGSLAAFRLSQVYVKSGNVLLDRVTWQVGTLESFLGDLGLYDIRPATVFFDTVGLSARYESKRVELLLGLGDSGFKRYGLAYNTLPTAGGTLRLRLFDGHVEIGGGGEVMIERTVRGNVHAPYQTPDIAYEDWIRGEVGERYVAEFGPELADFFPAPEPRTAWGGNAIGYLGFGGVGPLIWNNLFVSYRRQLPEKTSTDTLLGAPLTLYIHDFTDERTVLMVGNEMQLRLVPGHLDAAWGVAVRQPSRRRQPNRAVGPRPHLRLHRVAAAGLRHAHRAPARRDQLGAGMVAQRQRLPDARRQHFRQRQRPAGRSRPAIRRHRHAPNLATQGGPGVAANRARHLRASLAANPVRSAVLEPKQRVRQCVRTDRRSVQRLRERRTALAPRARAGDGGVVLRPFGRLALLAVAACVKTGPVAIATPGTSLTLVPTMSLYDDTDVRIMPQAVVDDLLTEARRHNVTADATMSADAARSLDAVLHVHCTPRFDTQVNGRFRWIVDCDARMTGQGTAHVEPRTLSMPAHLVYYHEREEEAVTWVTQGLIRRVGQVLQDWIAQSSAD